MKKVLLSLLYILSFLTVYMTKSVHSKSDSAPKENKKPEGRIFGELIGSILGPIGFGQNMCKTLGQVSLKNDCNKFLECSKVNSAGITKSCPGNHKFDFFTKKCSRKGNCEDELCKNNGKVYADPSEKSKYFLCSNGQMNQYSCLKKQRFSHFSHSCMPVVNSEDISAERADLNLTELLDAAEAEQ